MRTTETLRDHGWTVLRLWEHEVVKQPEDSAHQVVEAVHQLRRVKRLSS